VVRRELWLGAALAGVVNLLHVDTVVLDDVYAPLAPWLSPPVQRELAARGDDRAMVPGHGAPSVLVRTVRDHPAAWLS
jgi:hypothetical protein